MIPFFIMSALLLLTGCHSSVNTEQPVLKVSRDQLCANLERLIAQPNDTPDLVIIREQWLRDYRLNGCDK
jgi:hypothetical protein